MTIIDLRPGTTYYFALKTVDDAGNVSPLSNVLTKVTFSPGSSANIQIHLSLTAAPANLPDGGGSVTYDYAVSNPGSRALGHVTVRALGNGCEPILYASGDNGDNEIAPGERWIYRCTETLTKTTRNGAIVSGSMNSNDRYTVSDLAFITVEVGGEPLEAKPNQDHGVNGIGFDREREIADALNIDIDKDTTTTPETACAAGALIKGSQKAVYYCGRDGKRYVFPNEHTFFTWYGGFDAVQLLSDDLLASIPLGSNVTYRPGVRLVKIQTDPRVYAVSKGGILHWLKDEGIAILLYGTDWAHMVHDVPEAFFINYTLGDPISSGTTTSP